MFARIAEVIRLEVRAHCALRDRGIVRTRFARDVLGLDIAPPGWRTAA